MKYYIMSRYPTIGRRWAYSTYFTSWSETLRYIAVRLDAAHIHIRPSHPPTAKPYEPFVTIYIDWVKEP